MTLASLSSVLELPGIALSAVAGKLVQLLVWPGTFSLASLLSALCVATLYLGFKRQRRGKELRMKVLLRALFPKRLRGGRSGRADIGYFFFNAFVVGLLFGWAALTYHVVNNATNEALAATFGPMHPAALSDVQAAVIMTVVLFVAYELGYWIDHYLSHNVPVLWEFHKVHHTAEVLSPLTNFRVHPVETIIFNNILALVMGGAGGLANYWLGNATQPFTVAGSNVIVVVFFFLIGHLQHTHFWIAFTGVWGRILLSPAHHQIHHSTDPAHFNKNLGSFLAIWDWLFGTLYVPSRRREKLDFGVVPKSVDAHTITGGLVSPFGRSFAHIKVLLGFRETPADQPVPRAGRTEVLDAGALRSRS
jgi:sterol desaturase/sphingolipid hydroxylase (fatty acid hydroxylase superfamily)